jgi:hypothetical protein
MHTALEPHTSEDVQLTALQPPRAVPQTVPSGHSALVSQPLTVIKAPSPAQKPFPDTVSVQVQEGLLWQVIAGDVLHVMAQ